MFNSTSAQKERFLHEAASLYYNEGKTQAEVAELLGVSRTKVLRALQEARAAGIVQITIVDPSETNQSLASQLEDALGLDKVVVTTGRSTDANFTRKRVGHAAATHLKETLEDGATLGMGWGRTLYDVTRALEYSRPYHTQIIPLVGGLGKIAPSFQVHDMAREAAERLGGTWRAFYVPAIVESQEAYESLMASADVSHVTAAWAKLDVALVGLGNLDLGHDVRMLFADYLDADAIAQLEGSGAVGDVCMRFFDAGGKPTKGAMEHLFSIDLEQFARVPNKIAVACGARKAASIHGAARGGYINTLITDSEAAEEVLRLESRASNRSGK